MFFFLVFAFFMLFMLRKHGDVIGWTGLGCEYVREDLRKSSIIEMQYYRKIVLLALSPGFYGLLSHL